MKVLCVNMSILTNPVVPKLIEGNIYTASQAIIEKDYNIEESPYATNGNPCSYDKRHFIPCSDIDEMELIEQRQTQLA